MSEAVIDLINHFLNAMMAYWVFYLAREGRWDKAAGWALFYLLCESDRICNRISRQAS